MDKANGLFVCPKCGEPLTLIEKSYKCRNGHCYDVSRSTHVNLLPVNSKNSNCPGDNEEMIKARVIVMDKGYYGNLANYIAHKIKDLSPEVILDAGCGEGYVTGALKEFFPNATVIGTDISKSAIITASKKRKSVQYAVASSMRLPIKEASVDVLLCAFAPVFSEEFARVLRNKGLFIRVTPDVNHLFNLKSVLYEVPRVNELDPIEIDGFDLISEETVTKSLDFMSEEISALIKMTPYFYHTPKDRIESVSNISSLNINTEFNVRIYQKKD